MKTEHLKYLITYYTYFFLEDIAKIIFLLSSFNTFFLTLETSKGDMFNGVLIQ